MTSQQQSFGIQEPRSYISNQRAGSKSGSFLNPTGVNANEAPPNALGPFVELGIFMAFVMIRAIHPVVIDASKEYDPEQDKKVFMYQTSSVVVLMTCLLFVLCSSICYLVGGKAQFASIWSPKPLMLFSFNGLVYATGDFLEMASMGGLSGAAYQILLQSKILVTAILLIYVKGVFQTRLQWTLLFILMMSMSVYMVIMSSAKDSGSSGGALPIMGMILAFLKVFISCVGAVASDKYMKVYKDDAIHVHLARIFFSDSIVVLILTSLFTNTYTNGFFTGWTTTTLLVTLSFIVKSFASIYIVAVLDSLLKNIAESFSVLVIYAYDVLAPWVDKQFEISTFLAVMCVVSACAAYVDSKAPIEKASLWDEQEKLKAMMEGATGRPA